MDDYTFDTGMESLSKWFRKKLDDSQLKMWFGQIGHVPGTPFKKIINEIIATEKYFPVPQQIKDRYQFWLRDNPSKAYKIEREHCDECDSTGRLDYWMRSKNDQWYPWSCGCSLCKNWKHEFPLNVQLMTREQVSAIGGQFNNPLIEEPQGDEVEGPESSERISYLEFLRRHPDKDDLGDMALPTLEDELDPSVPYEEIDENQVPF